MGATRTPARAARTRRASIKRRKGGSEHEPLRAIGYARVSTAEQGVSGAGLEAQRRAIRAEISKRGWRLGTIFEDVMSGSTVNGRHGLEDALAAVESGEADIVVVTKIDRLSRSMRDFAKLMDDARAKHWGIVAMDLGLDTSTPEGEVHANVMMSFAQFERRRIGQRTREALAVKKSQGVRLGRPRLLPEAIAARIRKMHQAGVPMLTIARTLNEERVPTAQGGKAWHASTVSTVLHRDAP